MVLPKIRKMHCSGFERNDGRKNFQVFKKKVYRWPHNKAKKPKPPKPVKVRTPSPPPRPKKPEITTMERMGDEDSIRPVSIMFRKVGNGPYKSKYKSYWMQIVEKLNHSGIPDLAEFKDEIGYYKLFPWYSKRQSTLKSRMPMHEGVGQSGGTKNSHKKNSAAKKMLTGIFVGQKKS